MEVDNKSLLAFYEAISNFGSLDIARALQVFQEVGLYPHDLAEEVERYTNGELAELELSKVDVCYVAYDFILQQARNKIDEVLKFDFLNDTNGSISTYGNYCATTYDFGENDKQKLKEVLEKATEEQKEELREDRATFWFLNELDLKSVIEE